MIICFLGPEGTSDYRALSLLRSHLNLEPLPMSSLIDVIETVNFTPGCLGIIPIENSTDGQMTTILDKLIFDFENVMIREEVVLAERIDAFCLDPNVQASTVISHPLILDLCSQYIKAQSLTTRHSLSTAEACRTILEDNDPTAIALAPQIVGESFGLELVSNGVMDVSDIRTRYFVIGREISEKTGSDRTSIVVTPTLDRVGFLADVATVFAKNGVNMNHILSRPLSAKIGTYCFHIVLEGHMGDPGVVALMDDLLELDASIKLLGSYPRWSGVDVATPASNLPKGSIERVGAKI